MFTAEMLEASGLAVNGGPAVRLLEYGDLGACRPWKETDLHGRSTGRVFITLRGKPKPDGTPVCHNKLCNNAPGLLTREDWLKIDEGVAWQSKDLLNLWDLIYAANPYNVPDAMGVIALQHNIADGSADATMSMDGIRRAERTRPQQDKVLQPLPLTHADGRFTWREIAVARRGNLPIDTNTIRLSSRAISENVEGLCAGTVSFTYNNLGTIYGLTNFPYRSTKIMTSPLTSGWTPVTTINEVLDMLDTLQVNRYFGPYALIYSRAWRKHMQGDYNTATQTYTGDSLMTRLQKIADINRFVMTTSLTGYQMVIVQLTSDVVEGVQGFPITTVQWSEQGEFEFPFKLFAMQQPRLKADYSGKTGIVHGTGYLGGTSTTTTTTTTTP